MSSQSVQSNDYLKSTCKIQKKKKLKLKSESFRTDTFSPCLPFFFYFEVQHKHEKKSDFHQNFRFINFFLNRTLQSSKA